MVGTLSERSLAVILGGVGAGLLAAAVQTSGGGLSLGQALPKALFGVGLPTVAASLAVSYVQGTDDQNTMTALVIGGASVGIMMLLGELPYIVDTQTLMLVGIVAGGNYAGNQVAHWIAHGK